MKAKYRHELKHEISLMDYYVLLHRLSAVAYGDVHGENGSYQIRSLYFDDDNDSALKEKIAGISIREKFRLRYYNGDITYIRLEKKSKINGLCMKEAVVLSINDAQKVLKGDYEWMKNDDRRLLRELYIKLQTKGLKPKTIVDYKRDAFIFPAGNVRVTLDRHIRVGRNYEDFFEAKSDTLPIVDDPIILEVKWDEFLPTVIRDAVQLCGRKKAAFSKYAACRMYD